MVHRVITAVLVGVLGSGAAVSARQGAQPVKLRFAAVVGGSPVACGQTYTDIGTTHSAISFVDFRYYISRVRLLKADGSEQPVALTQDGLWQVDDVALLDFENGSAGCANGTEQTRDIVEGTVPPGTYLGVRFDLGLPFEKNHVEATLQPSPLNLSRMFWSWNGGYKFLRMDIRTTGQPKGWMLHLGSTGCTPAEKPSTIPTSCVHRNVATVDLPGFNHTADVVEMDVKTLLARSDVDSNAPKTAIGCMSGLTDPECPPLLSQFGLMPGEGQPTVQTVFRTQRAQSLAPR